jgi:hypothetical protein
MNEFDDLARELRHRVGGDVRAEAAEDETLTELQRLRARDLSDVAREAMHRGDSVTIRVAGLSFTHPIASVGADYLVMTTPDSVVDVHLPRAVLSVEPRPSGGRTGRPAAWTFRARLAEHEQASTPVEIALDTGDRIEGTIEVAATDHVVVSDGETAARSLVPIGLIGAVLSRPRPGPG